MERTRWARALWLAVPVLALAACGDGGRRRDTGASEEDAVEVGPDDGPETTPDVLVPTPDALPPAMDAALDVTAPSLDGTTVTPTDTGPSPTDASDEVLGPDTSEPACATGLRRCAGRCVDIASDSTNCGACGNVCTGGAHAVAACSAGECERSCDRGFADCDSLAANGCEADLASSTTCGVCTRACASGQVCAGGMCSSSDAAPPPRQFAPLSGSRVSRRRPELVWFPVEGAGGTQIQVCRSRGCEVDRVVATFDASGNRAAVPMDLTPGVYFWRARTGAPGRYGTRYSPTWQFRVSARDGGSSLGWGAEPDFNGDGFADIAVGATGGMGAAYVFYGSATGPRAAPDFTAPGRDGVDARYAISVTALGDTNGDGFVDLGVSASDVALRAGSVFVHQGGALGLSATRAASSGTMRDQRTGEGVGALGDVNGDGYADFASGGGIAGVSGNGIVLVFNGRAVGPDSVPTQTLLASPSIDETRLGRTLSGTGDVNGDGFPDLIAGAPGLESPSYAYLFNGGPMGLETRSSLRLQGRGTAAMPALAEFFSVSIAGVGDVNGDGFNDVLIGATGTMNRGGYVRLYLGSMRGLDATAAWERAGTDNDNVGYGVSGGVDVNGDGYDDVAVISAGINTVRIWYGGPMGPVGEGVALEGAEGMAFQPRRVATLGDVNGDGYGDVIVGVPESEENRGSVLLYYGAREGIATRPAWVGRGPDAGGSFGNALGRW